MQLRAIAPRDRVVPGIRLHAVVDQNAGVRGDAFRTLQGSTATGSQNIGRLTNLKNLTVDASWYVRYRSTTNACDLWSVRSYAANANLGRAA